MIVTGIVIVIEWQYATLSFSFVCFCLAFLEHYIIVTLAVWLLSDSMTVFHLVLYVSV